MKKNGSFQVYYGGSFDPPHKGHFEIISFLIQDPWIEKLHLVPTFQNPLKAEQNSGTLWNNPSLRWKWVNALVEDIKDYSSSENFNKLILENSEFEKKENSYTIDTLISLKKRENCPSSQWVLAMGSDLLEGLEKWKQINSLLNEISGVWIFTRGLDEKVEDKIPNSLRSLSNFRIMNQSISPISSTEIRENYSKTKVLKADESFSPKVRQAILSSIE